MASEWIIKVDENNFEQDVLNSEIPVIVDFWAEWCGPCKMVKPVLEQFAEEQQGRVVIASLNVDEQQKLAYQFQVQSIPTFILFKNGQMAGRMMGAMSKSAFEAFVERNL